MKSLNICPSTLAAGYETYSPIARKRLFDGKNISPFLPYNPIEEKNDEITLFLKNQQHISLSGVQSKYSLVVRDNSFELSNASEQGTYILKPKLTNFQFKDYSPANENLTMQLAEQVYNIETAANGLCFFKNGEMAYVTKRFDVSADGSKYRMEDFASLAGLTSENKGKDFKYDVLSYEDAAELIQKYASASRVEILKFFDLMLFNFLFSNGDAHLKNFSLLETSYGDFKLSPAYDLINTGLHLPNNPIFALSKGLFKEGDKKVCPMGIYTGNTFLEFGKRLGLPERIVKREIEKFSASYIKAEELISNSYLSDELKDMYKAMYHTRRDSYLKG
jgi:serine/threonine-protein kinase HipA